MSVVSYEIVDDLGILRVNNPPVDVIPDIWTISG